MADKKETIEYRVQLVEQHQQIISDFLTFIKAHAPELQFKIIVETSLDADNEDQIVLKIQTKENDNSHYTQQCFIPKFINNDNRLIFDILAAVSMGRFACQKFEILFADLCLSKAYKDHLRDFKANADESLKRIENFKTNHNDFMHFKKFFEEEISRELVDRCKTMGITNELGAKHSIQFLCEVWDPSKFYSPKDILCTLVMCILEKDSKNSEDEEVVNEKFPNVQNEALDIFIEYLSHHGLVDQSQLGFVFHLTDLKKLFPPIELAPEVPRFECYDKNKPFVPAYSENMRAIRDMITQDIRTSFSRTKLE